MSLLAKNELDAEFNLLFTERAAGKKLCSQVFEILRVLICKVKPSSEKLLVTWTGGYVTGCYMLLGFNLL